MMNNDPQFRDLRPEEKTLLASLLQTPFPGSTQLATQLENCEVREIDQCGILTLGSLDLQTSYKERAPVVNPVPVEAEAEDVDGITVHLLLHVVNGFLRELEIYKDDLSDVVVRVDPSKLRVRVNGAEEE